jgi:hypothetical protein
MQVSHGDLFARFKGNQPASLESIDRCQGGLEFSLPADYVQFLLKMDGGEGFIGDHFLMLWSVERFVEMNTSTYFAEAAPGLVVFGSDGRRRGVRIRYAFYPATDRYASICGNGVGCRHRVGA